MAEIDKTPSGVSKSGIVKSRLSTYFPRGPATKPLRDFEPQRDISTEYDAGPDSPDPVVDHVVPAVEVPGPLPDDAVPALENREPLPDDAMPAFDDPALFVDSSGPDISTHGDHTVTNEGFEADAPVAEISTIEEHASEIAEPAKTAAFAVRPVPARFAPPEPHFELEADSRPEQVQRPQSPPPSPPPPTTNSEVPPPRQRPINEETLASIIAGRTFENDEAERAFLLTLSRDQRLKYAELVHADDQLELDVQRHNLQLDQLDFERERLEANERTRRSENAVTFANQAIRILLVLNGLGAIVVLGVWGYLAATPGARFAGGGFEQALWALGLGAVATVLTALSSYVAQALAAIDDSSRMWYWLIVGTRGFGISMAVAGFLAFLIGLSLASYGLSTS